MLKSTKLTSIAFGRNRNEIGINYVNQLTKKGDLGQDKCRKRMKTRQELEDETSKNMELQEYIDLNEAVKTMLRNYGISWTTLRDYETGPHHLGLTSILNWKEKASKHFYNFLRQKKG